MISSSILPRFEHFMLPGNVRLGIHPTRKLKTILVKVYLAADLDDTATSRALLPMVLRRGTSRLRDMQAINRYLESLYGAGIWSSVAKIGEWHVTRFRLEVVNDLFLREREDLFRRGIEFLREILLDPLVVDEGFHPDYVAREKETLRVNIESLLDDKGAYAAFRCAEEMCREEAYRLNEQGRVDQLDAIEARRIYGSYRDWMDACPLAVYVAGDVDIDVAREMVANVFRSQRSGSGSLRPAPPPVPVRGVKVVKERLEVNQGKLVLGFRHGITHADELYEALLVMNGVLGGFSHSKLFQNVREKASLAYSASSWLERTKGLLFIACGIAVEKYDRALAISLEQVEAMRRGEISEEEIDSTVKTILNQNLMLEDNFSALADVDYSWGLHGRDLDLAGFRERLQNVSRERIVEAARKLEHDTTYFLHN